ncbi:unnamed protein product [Somion occarium]|uniref:F-box domain-containing protein n=1 Tax=Somion occarium TaxID=3059160 RepID=A0ABP1E9Q9_9APHY
MAFPPPPLPLELTDAIIDELSDDRDSLKAIALTSPKFVGRAKKHLHREVVISSAKPETFERLEGCFSGFKGFVKVLRLAFMKKRCKEGVDLAKRIAPHLQKLEEIKIEDTVYDEKLFNGLIQSLDRVHTLRLSNVWFNSFAEFAALLSHLPNLRNLRMHRVRTEDTHHDDSYRLAAKSDPPPLLEVIHTGGCLFSGQLFEWLCRLPELRIRSAQLIFPSNVDGTPLFEFMKRTSGSLTHLDLDLYTSRYPLGILNGSRKTDSTFTKPLLVNMPKLESITFGSLPLCPDSSPGPEGGLEGKLNLSWVTDILKDADPTSLSHIQFNCTLWEVQDLEYFPFEEAASVLTTRHFPSLQSVTFLISLEYAKKEDFTSKVSCVIRDRLHTLAKDGILHIHTPPANTLGEWRRERGSNWGRGPDFLFPSNPPLGDELLHMGFETIRQVIEWEAQVDDISVSDAIFERHALNIQPALPLLRPLGRGPAHENVEREFLAQVLTTDAHEWDPEYMEPLDNFVGTYLAPPPNPGGLGQ